MARTTKKTTRKPTANPGLVSHYQAIGPGAIIAALLCTPRHRVNPAARPTKSA